jgi:hypothetical protein
MSLYSQDKSHLRVIVAVVLAGMSAAFTLEGCQMSKVIKKEQILLGDIGKPNFPEKVGAWRLGSEWKTEGQVGGEWGHRVTVAYIHEQDAEKQVAITLTLYRSTDGAKRALKKELAAVEEHNRHEETKGVGVEMLKLFGVSRWQAGTAWRRIPLRGISSARLQTAISSCWIRSHRVRSTAMSSNSSWRVSFRSS